MRKKIYLLAVTFFLFLYNIPLLALNGWSFKSTMPTPRTGICTVVWNGKIYIIGGRDGSGRVLDLVERYDLINDTWDTDFPHLKEKRENAAAVVFGGTIFVLGGRNKGGKILKKVEFFKESEYKWENFRDMEEKREGLTAVVLNDVLFAVGGLGELHDDNEQFLDDVEYYNLVENKWMKSMDWQLDFAKASFATVAIQDSAFSIGGFSTLGPLGFVQRFHPTAGTAERSRLLTPRGGLAATANNDTIFVFGGRNQNDQVLNSVEFFVPQLNIWRKALPLNTARENFTAVTVNNEVYVIGGRDANGNVVASIEVAEAADVVTSVAIKNPLPPTDFRLSQNYPNPFNAGTKITFQISSDINSSVKLAIYNLRGQLIRVLVDKKLGPGNYEVLWAGSDQNGVAVASGIYFYTLQQGVNKISKKMTLIR